MTHLEKADVEKVYPIKSETAKGLTPLAAARRLGISLKALRLYEAAGLIEPGRSAAGWRSYDAACMDRARQVVALRRLGLSLAAIGPALAGEAQALAAALLVRIAAIESEIGNLSRAVAKAQAMRAALAHGALGPGDGIDLGAEEPTLGFCLPWPWGGERFEIAAVAPLTFITGPLGSGKTRLAQAIAENLQGGRFMAMEDREEEGRAVGAARLQDAAFAQRLAPALDWLRQDGAGQEPALAALAAALTDPTPGALVIDMVEHRLGEASQAAFAAFARTRLRADRPLFLMTRSSAMLDLADLCPGETVIYCPANHAPPFAVAPHLGAAGYEAVETCLAAPAVRARTEGMVAVRPVVMP